MSKFTINIPCKPYVKRFLELNYGSPVDFTKDKTLYIEFRNKLMRPSTRYNNCYDKLKFDRYSETVSIKITESDFYQYGWDLSITDMVNFNVIIESRAKTFMYIIVGTRLSFGQYMTDCIGYFQQKYDFPETVWPKESMIKDCQRNLNITKNEIVNNISEMIDKITIVKLSEKRTISHKLKKEHESTKF